MRQNFENRKDLDKQLEELPFSDDYRADVILAAAKLKRAAELPVKLPLESTPDERERIVRRTQQVLHTIGLRTARGDRVRTPHMYGEGPVLFAARTQNDAEALAELDIKRAAEGDTLENMRAEGEFYGYPKTSVEAYCKAETENAHDLLLRDQELPNEIKEQGLRPFLNFRLSKQHWREELETVRTWAETIKQRAPKLYERILKGD